MAFNRYVVNLRKIVSEARNEMAKAQDKAEFELSGPRKRLKDGLITQKGFEELKEAAYEGTSGIGQAAIEKIDAEKERYFAAVDDWETPSAEKIVPDMQLLSGVFPLTGDELIGLATKHRDNPLMVRAIKKHANDNNIGDFYTDAADGSAKKEAFTTVVKYAHNAIAYDDYAPVILDDEHFAKIYNPALDGEPN